MVRGSYSKSSGGKASKRVEVALRRRRVALMLRGGMTQAEVAGALGVSEATVSGDVGVLKEMWRGEALADIGQMVAGEIAALDGDEVWWREVMEGGARTVLEKARAYDRVMSIMGRRAALAGLDAEERRRERGTAMVEGLDELLGRVLTGSMDEETETEA